MGRGPTPDLNSKKIGILIPDTWIELRTCNRIKWNEPAGLNDDLVKEQGVLLLNRRKSRAFPDETETSNTRSELGETEIIVESSVKTRAAEKTRTCRGRALRGELGWIRRLSGTTCLDRAGLGEGVGDETRTSMA
jgi:hypothetical protein